MCKKVSMNVMICIISSHSIPSSGLITNAPWHAPAPSSQRRTVCLSKNSSMRTACSLKERGDGYNRQQTAGNRQYCFKGRKYLSSIAFCREVTVLLPSSPNSSTDRGNLIPPCPLLSRGGVVQVY